MDFVAPPPRTLDGASCVASRHWSCAVTLERFLKISVRRSGDKRRPYQKKFEIPMPRKLSTIAPDWWDYTTLDDALIEEAARLTPADMGKLSRDGFRLVFCDPLEDFYLAEALEYIAAWRQATPDNPVGICGPIGPTEQLPLVARLVNELGLNVRSAHFWGMDEWYLGDREVPVSHPLSFERADRELCFSRIRPELVMPPGNLHFPKAD